MGLGQAAWDGRKGWKTTAGKEEVKKEKSEGKKKRQEAGREKKRNDKLALERLWHLRL